MPRVKLGTGRQITIPAQTIKRLGIQIGEELKVMEADKAIILVLHKYIPKDQQSYYTKEWQQMMQEAFDAIKKGEVLDPFSPVERATQVQVKS